MSRPLRPQFGLNGGRERVLSGISTHSHPRTSHGAHIWPAKYSRLDVIWFMFKNVNKKRMCLLMLACPKSEKVLARNKNQDTTCITNQYILYYYTIPYTTSCGNKTLYCRIVSGILACVFQGVSVRANLMCRPSDVVKIWLSKKLPLKYLCDYLNFIRWANKLMDRQINVYCVHVLSFFLFFA